jgi:polysaccharide pyruvyl transferase WcaK-like protein
MFVATRFHGAVFCAKSLTPFVSIDYDPKVRGFMRQIDLEEYCYTALDLKDLVEMYNRKSSIEKQISKKLRELEKLAYKNFDYI